MNHLDLCLEVVSKSRQPLRYIILMLNISEIGFPTQVGYPGFFQTENPGFGCL